MKKVSVQVQKYSTALLPNENSRNYLSTLSVWEKPLPTFSQDMSTFTKYL